MKVVCSYCRKEMDERPPFRNKIVTHSICPECFDYYKDQVDGLPYDVYLDKFDVPVLIVDKDARVLTLNKQAADMTGKSQSELVGLLAGEAMECVYARMSGGCGKTVHCLECSIRNALEAAMENGEPQKRVPAFCTQGESEIKMLISTEKIGGLVRIVIENVSEH